MDTVGWFGGFSPLEMVCHIEYQLLFVMEEVVVTDTHLDIFTHYLLHRHQTAGGDEVEGVGQGEGGTWQRRRRRGYRRGLDGGESWTRGRDGIVEGVTSREGGGGGGSGEGDIEEEEEQRGFRLQGEICRGGKGIWMEEDELGKEEQL